MDTCLIVAINLNNLTQTLQNSNAQKKVTDAYFFFFVLFLFLIQDKSRPTHYSYKLKLNSSSCAPSSLSHPSPIPKRTLSPFPSMLRRTNHTTFLVPLILNLQFLRRLDSHPLDTNFLFFLLWTFRLIYLFWNDNCIVNCSYL